MLEIIAVTYGQDAILKCFINSIKAQTSQNWKLTLVHDGPNEELQKDLKDNGYLDKKVSLICHPEHTGVWGNHLRRMYLERMVSSARYVLITNGDNYYCPVMVEEVLKRKEDVVFFDCIHNYELPYNHNSSSYGLLSCSLQANHVDMGAVAINRRLAQRVGFHGLGGTADWEYFQAVLNHNPTTHKIDKVLLVHN
jgi:hypothetical protein